MGRAAYAREALEEPTARAVVEALLRGAVEQLSSPRHPQGCLLVQGALSCGRTADPIRRELAARRAAVEAAIRRRFKRAISDDDLPADTDAGDLARYVSTVMYGMAVRAAGGASRKELLRVVKWPCEPGRLAVPSGRDREDDDHRLAPMAARNPSSVVHLLLGGPTIAGAAYRDGRTCPAAQRVLLDLMSRAWRLLGPSRPSTPQTFEAAVLDRFAGPPSTDYDSP